MSEAKPPNVFVSYAVEDRDFASRLIRDLAASKIEVWSDRDLQLGENVIDKMSELIEAANNYIFILSSNSTTSNSVNNELTLAIASLGARYHKRIFPVVGEKGASIPLLLDQYQILDLSDQPAYSQNFPLLVQALRKEPPVITKDALKTVEELYKAADAISELTDKTAQRREEQFKKILLPQLTISIVFVIMSATLAVVLNESRFVTTGISVGIGVVLAEIIHWLHNRSAEKKQNTSD